jgi:hypothetical protein
LCWSFKGADTAGVVAEHFEEIAPEALRFGVFSGCVPVFAGEGCGAVPDFVKL